jgi:hypothetical protein
MFKNKLNKITIFLYYCLIYIYFCLFSNKIDIINNVYKSLLGLIICICSSSVTIILGSRLIELYYISNNSNNDNDNEKLMKMLLIWVSLSSILLVYYFTSILFSYLVVISLFINFGLNDIFFDIFIYNKNNNMFGFMNIINNNSNKLSIFLTRICSSSFIILFFYLIMHYIHYSFNIDFFIDLELFSSAATIFGSHLLFLSMSIYSSYLYDGYTQR